MPLADHTARPKEAGPGGEPQPWTKTESGTPRTRGQGRAQPETARPRPHSRNQEAGPQRAIAASGHQRGDVPAQERYAPAQHTRPGPRPQRGPGSRPRGYLRTPGARHALATPRTRDKSRSRAAQTLVATRRLLPLRYRAEAIRIYFLVFFCATKVVPAGGSRRLFRSRQGSHPQFASIVTDLNLISYWREYGWPENCGPEPTLGIQCH